jgi:hypothetical protein
MSSKLNLATRTAVAMQDIDQAILRGFIETFPDLKYDYDRVCGEIPVPFGDGKVYVHILSDPQAPDRFRIKCAERHHVEADAFIRTSAGYWPTAANDNVEGHDVGHALASTADPFASGVPGGLLSDIAEFIIETSPSPIREFATMAAVSFLAAHFGRRAVTPTGLGLNLYVALVAPTGWGKDRPLSALPQLAAAVGQDNVVGPNDFASDSALELILRRQPCQVLPIDELGMFFKAADRYSETHSQSKIKAIVELFSRGTGQWVAKVRASDGGKNGKAPLRPHIRFPTLSILGATTPSTLYAAFHADAFESGLIPRWLFISIDKEPPLNDIEGFAAVPMVLVDRLKQALADLPKSGNLSEASFVDSSRVPAVHVVPWATGEAKAELKAIRLWGRAFSRYPEREIEAQVVSRTGEIVSKLATIRAISTNPAEPAVTVEDVRWALGIARMSHAAVIRDAERHMSGSDFEALCNAIVEHVRKAGECGLKHSDLLRRSGVSKAKPQDLRGAIERLVDSDQITDAGNQGRAGRKGSRYVLAG